MPVFTIPNGPLPEQPRRRPTAHRLWSRMREVTVDARGNHHASAGSAIGGQFIPKKGGEGTSAMPPASSSSLSTSSATGATAMEGGANAVVRVDLDDGTTAVFKPEVGEAWPSGRVQNFQNGDIDRYVTNRSLSLGEREAMAYEVDQMLGTDLVPETVHRHDLGLDLDDVERDEDVSDNAWDEGELRTMYRSYREGEFENAAERAGEGMYELYSEAQEEHVRAIKSRAAEMAEIWNDILDEHPEYADEGPYGRRSALEEHPTLPMGTQQFERRSGGGEVDPLEVLDKAGVDVDASESGLDNVERDRVRAILEKELANGAQVLLDVDEEKAAEHLEYGDWIEQHGETEGRLIDEQIMSFTKWREAHGYEMREDDGGSVVRRRNPRAPHPNGGSLQRFVEGLESGSYLLPGGEETHRFAVLDFTIGSMDRHAGNVFRSPQKVLGMDNGYTFPAGAAPKFRSMPVLRWLDDRAAGRKTEVSEPLRQRLLTNITNADWQGFLNRHPALSTEERVGFLQRVDQMTRALRTPNGLYELWREMDYDNRVHRGRSGG